MRAKYICNEKVQNNMEKINRGSSSTTNWTKLEPTLRVAKGWG